MADGGNPLEKLKQNIAAAHEQLKADLKDRDPSAQVFYNFFRKDLGNARKSMGLPALRTDDSTQSMTVEEATKRAALHALVMDRRLRELERRLRPFNIFDVLKSADNEIRHSNVLAWLLDPKGTHGLNDLFLRQWLIRVFYGIESPGSYLDPVEIDSVPFRSVSVKREWNHIDVLVEIETATHGRWVICVENKVWATQSEYQLKTYKQVVEDVFPDHLRVYIYLTATEEPPDDPSYVIGTYAHVRSALETCLEERAASIGDDMGILRW